MNVILMAKNQPILEKLLLGEDLIPFLQWWLTILILGIIFLPLSSLLFSSLADKGYLFSKAIGIGLSAYIMWFLSSIKVMKFTTGACVVSLGLGLLINLLLVLYFKYLFKPANSTLYTERNILSAFYNKKNILIFITEELLFLLIFLFFTYIRGFKPEAYGTEKFMDYGFMTTMMRSDYMPPQDFWFSGNKLNYYYVGQFIATYLTKLSFTPVTHGYNLMLMMTGAFAFMLPFSLTFNLIMRYITKHGKGAKAYAYIGGLIGGAGVCIAGNMHYPIYGLIIPFFKNLKSKVKIPYSYWFPDATRYIGYSPETNDKTIHEFPSYSFILGDLHAHVVNILFVLTVLAILLSWLYGQTDRHRIVKKLKEELINPQIIMLAFFIGLFHTTNFWDYPIFYVVSGAIILFSNMIEYGFKAKAYWLTGLQGVLIFTLGELFALPFTLQFDQISASALLAENHTPLYQFMVLWGLPIFTVLMFITLSIIDYKDKRKKEKKRKKAESWINAIGKQIASYMDTLPDTDFFVITISLCAMGLVLLPELVYVKDIYSGDYKRANTMFKLTYQAFIMFGICFGYIYIRLLRFSKGVVRKVLAGLSLTAFCLTLLYPLNAVKGWYGDIFDRQGYKGIDATQFLWDDFKDDYLAIEWLNENVTGTPVVLEANGYSYTAYQRVSVITGLPTVFGWYTHEQLWRSGPDTSDDAVVALLNGRANDVETIYTSSDMDLVSDLIDKYNIEYIYVGTLEKEKYIDLNHETIRSLGEVVFEDFDWEEYDYRAYIVKVN